MPLAKGHPLRLTVYANHPEPLRVVRAHAIATFLSVALH
jgi:hypothetical protein